ncbi:MAG: DUF2059 domain-containing protein [Hoeflea sp.]|uniref:DUF2059 domain-containing protein n=1 Tax=Hoeflea sp. TaxID=1940281 RepID=UPI001DB18990|nr:DUF2059 domain-containing protein [Hoeflea sp.]MBU4530475.1 DUF2059 domain-containing protein [Alphaproteobacteria bacterium]MBU4545262.1 DUF2059 domain-containing protein [Alphaproteobacteria bacterium]MBU4548911.1 DUF2059 domain-containing protein [Alphaproteobacteria bacterium]MBV1722066.1 DUF2059 domain-containing protein [Hoeflea sp.]MBV1761416.1 DUF2059 domain-containing protein [Hoeflea sp.]
MTNFTGLKRFGAGLIVASSLVMAGHSAQAQELSQEHLAAARAAISALGATDQFDAVIPATAEQLKTELIRSNADLQEVITVTIDEEALKIVPRRADLEREAAQIYAKSFTQEELTAISDFYSSAPGRKLIENGPLVTRELLKSAEIWASGVGRDLAQNVGAALQEKIGERPRLDDEATPAAKP